MSRRATLCLVPALLLAGCAVQHGDFPSLAPRPYERGGVPTAVTPPVAPADHMPAPADPLSHGEHAALDAARDRAAAAEAAFASALATTQPLVAAARHQPSGSEAWSIAQLAISRLETQREAMVAVLADLDRLKIAREVAEQDGAPAGGADMIGAVAAGVNDQAAAARRTIDALAASLPD